MKVGKIQLLNMSALILIMLMMLMLNDGPGVHGALSGRIRQFGEYFDRDEERDVDAVTVGLENSCRPRPES